MRVSGSHDARALRGRDPERSSAASCRRFPGAHAVRDALRPAGRVTGVTVHVVDESSDGGPIVAQRAVAVRRRRYRRDARSSACTPWSISSPARRCATPWRGRSDLTGRRSIVDWQQGGCMTRSRRGAACRSPTSRTGLPSPSASPASASSSSRPAARPRPAQRGHGSNRCCGRHGLSRKCSTAVSRRSTRASPRACSPISAAEHREQLAAAS